MAGWDPIMEEAVNHRSFGAYDAGVWRVAREGG
jgi:hypothetical protein